MSSMGEILQDLLKDEAGIVLREGEVLIQENTAPNAVFLLVHGKLFAVIEKPENKCEIVDEIGVGEIVGEMALLTGGYRTASIVAARDCIVKRIEKKKFEEILLQNPDFLMMLTKMIALRLERTTKRINSKFSVRNIVLIQAGNGSEHSMQCVRALSKALSLRRKCAFIDADLVRNKFKNARFASADDVGEEAVLADWLENLEAENECVVFFLDSRLDWWAKKCIGLADRIYLIGELFSDPSLNAVEKYLIEVSLKKGPRRIELVLHRAGHQEVSETQKWIIDRKVTRWHHVSREQAKDFERVVRFIVGEHLGVVLSGGGARGLAQMGVLQAIKDTGISIDVIGGVSIGSIVAGLHCLGLPMREQLDRVRHFSELRKPYRRFGLPLFSLLRTNPIESFYFDLFQNAEIEDSLTEYFAVTCDLSRAHLKVLSQGLFINAVRASSAVPGIFEPVVEEGSLYVDAGIMDNMPVDEMVRRGPKHIIAVDVSPSEDLNVDKKLVRAPRAFEIIKQKFGLSKLKTEFPTMSEIMVRSMMLSSIEKKSQTLEMADLVLNPPVRGVRMLDFSQMEKLVEDAYVYSLPILEKWKGSL